jgi:hypothetical protein
VKTALDHVPAKQAKKREEESNRDSHAEERAVRAELQDVHAKPKTMLSNAYRGRK